MERCALITKLVNAPECFVSQARGPVSVCVCVKEKEMETEGDGGRGGKERDRKRERASEKKRRRGMVSFRFRMLHHRLKPRPSVERIRRKALLSDLSDIVQTFRTFWIFYRPFGYLSDPPVQGLAAEPAEGKS